MTEFKGRSRSNIVRSRDAAYADAAERVRFQASFAEKLLNALMIANGGAIIGLFTFLGNLIGKQGSPIHVSVVPIWAAFVCFVLGLALTLAAHIMAFLSQQMFYFQAMEEVDRFDRAIVMDEPQMDRSAEIAHNSSGNRHYARGMAMAGVGIILFVAGCASALIGLLPA